MVIKNPGIHLQLSQHQSPDGLKYQCLTIELTHKDRLINPDELEHLELPPGIDATGGVVISGRGPIWLYSYLARELHPTAWIACNDPRLGGAVVVGAYSDVVKVGQIIQLETPPTHALCPALMVVGPPDSGKSVFSHALFQSLLRENPDIYLQRANWDGEGNYVLALESHAEREGYKRANKGGLTPDFFPYHGQAILQLRRQKKLVIVDVGGMVQPEKQPVLEACSHYLIISSQPDAVQSWHEFCRDRGNLTPVAVIFSVLEDVETVERLDPYLEITCGPWVMGQTKAVPEVLLHRVRSLLEMPNSQSSLDS